MSIACFFAGILIDIDHIFDYIMNNELGDKLRYLRHPSGIPKFLSSGYNNYRRTYASYKIFHCVELLIIVPFLYAFGIWNSIATGILIGFLIHLSMDALAIIHPGQISLIYKWKIGFPTGGEIVKRRLAKRGMDINKCQLCGVSGETTIYRERTWYSGSTVGNLDKMMVLCLDCQKKVHDKTEEQSD